MGRPADWQPLAESDPVPGDPAGISSEAAHLASVAQQIASQVGVLRSIAAGQSDEKGQHIEKLKAAASDTAGHLDQVTGRYQQTASALSAWVPELEYAQAQSLKALARAQDAAARQQASQPVQQPPGTKLTPADQQADHLRAQALQQATGDLAAAQAMLEDAVAHRDDKASQTAARIEEAASAGADSWLESMWAEVKAFTDRYAWLISDICTVLEVIGTIAAIVALFLTGGVLIALLIAAGATLLALMGRTLLAATGNGAWLDVAVDAFALLTLGLGGGAFEEIASRIGLGGRAANILEEAVGTGGRIAGAEQEATARMVAWAGKLAEAMAGGPPGLVSETIARMGEVASKLAYPTAEEVAKGIPEEAGFTARLLNGGNDAAVQAQKMAAIAERFRGYPEIAQLAGKFGRNLWGMRAVIGVGTADSVGSLLAGRVPWQGSSGQVWHVAGMIPENPVSQHWDQWEQSLAHGLPAGQTDAVLRSLSEPILIEPPAGFALAGSALGG